MLYTHGPREMKAGINKSISPAAAKEEEGGYFEADQARPHGRHLAQTEFQSHVTFEGMSF